MKTAVEWLVETIEKNRHKPIRELFVYVRQAKEMEKEQMLNAFQESRLTHPMIGFKHETFKDYYNETFKQQEQ